MFNHPVTWIIQSSLFCVIFIEKCTCCMVFLNLRSFPQKGNFGLQGKLGKLVFFFFFPSSHHSNKAESGRTAFGVQLCLCASIVSDVSMSVGTCSVPVWWDHLWARATDSSHDGWGIVLPERSQFYISSTKMLTPKLITILYTGQILSQEAVPDLFSLGDNVFHQKIYCHTHKKSQTILRSPFWEFKQEPVLGT